MAYSEDLAIRVRNNLARRCTTVEKRMFGGLAFLLNGNILVGVWKDSLIVRLGSENHAAALREPNVKDFDITGKPMQGWVLVEPDGVEGHDQLSDWTERALSFVRTLPAK